MKIEALEAGREPDSGIGLNGSTIPVFIEERRFPTGSRTLAVCEQHLEDGPAAEYAGEWFIGGCIYPDSKDEDPIIRARFACPGPSVVRGCRFRIEQFDAAGNPMSGFGYAWEKLKDSLPDEDKARIKHVSLAAAGTALLTAATIAYAFKRSRN